ncbi:formyltransferase family protein [Paenibacillus planticolens]|uniref:Formyl transferase n=1 Tax=Paenibacillus planticolens TaxID=2654976 RepID=A0ABX1ZK46_9BACL|nr:formyltransferase family protein [Paenibacillus planticolens]NOV00464.1 formyl transferase [Paenibacillus planticolens]
MHILLLGPYREQVVKFLESNGDQVTILDGKLKSDDPILVDWIISYGYRYIIKPDLIEKYKNRIINLHISLLPWNRGADPNLWSFLEDTPKGVSIHYMDTGIDTGDILVQKEIEFSDEETLSSTYEALSKCIENLFYSQWSIIRDGKLKGIKQSGQGSFHYSKDKEKYLHLMLNGWNTPIRLIAGRAINTDIGGQDDENIHCR